MDKSLTKVELKLLSCLLDRAEEEFADHGCNDFSLGRDGGLTPKESRELVETSQAHTTEDEALERGDFQFDTLLYAYFKKRVEQLLESQ